jgi:hypothetical protein
MKKPAKAGFLCAGFDDPSLSQFGNPITVGAGLPAIAVCQPTSMQDLPPPSQASLLPH